MTEREIRVQEMPKSTSGSPVCTLDHLKYYQFSLSTSK